MLQGCHGGAAGAQQGATWLQQNETSGNAASIPALECLALPYGSYHHTNVDSGDVSMWMVAQLRRSYEYERVEEWERSGSRTDKQWDTQSCGTRCRGRAEHAADAGGQMHSCACLSTRCCPSTSKRSHSTACIRLHLRGLSSVSSHPNDPPFIHCLPVRPGAQRRMRSTSRLRYQHTHPSYSLSPPSAPLLSELSQPGPQASVCRSGPSAQLQLTALLLSGLSLQRVHQQRSGCGRHLALLQRSGHIPGYRWIKGKVHHQPYAGRQRPTRPVRSSGGHRRGSGRGAEHGGAGGGGRPVAATPLVDALGLPRGVGSGERGGEPGLSGHDHDDGWKRSSGGREGAGQTKRWEGGASHRTVSLRGW